MPKILGLQRDLFLVMKHGRELFPFHDLLAAESPLKDVSIEVAFSIPTPATAIPPMNHSGGGEDRGRRYLKDPQRYRPKTVGFGKEPPVKCPGVFLLPARLRSDSIPNPTVTLSGAQLDTKAKQLDRKDDRLDAKQKRNREVNILLQGYKAKFGALPSPRVKKRQNTVANQVPDKVGLVEPRFEIISWN